MHAVEYHFPNAKVILFGSRARGTHKEGADIDIALDVGFPIPMHEMTRIRATMENLTIPLEVDVVDMHSIPSELKAIILKEGVVWKS
ncbi:MAG: nucleotidyltransferase domain-containing protein [Candidatus Babeliales bacterium]